MPYDRPVTDPTPPTDSRIPDCPITIIVPVHNEADIINRAVFEICKAADAAIGDYQLVLVENGSSDTTYPQAQQLAAADNRLRVITNAVADYGLAIRTGIEQTRPQGWLVLFDIDYYSRAFLKRLVELADRADVIIASKRAPGSEDHRPWLRQLATRVFNLLLRHGVGSQLTDTHGIKAIRAQVAHELLPEVRLTQDLFDTELVLRAERRGYRIREVPVVVSELREARTSLLRRIPRTLRGLVKLRRSLD